MSAALIRLIASWWWGGDNLISTFLVITSAIYRHCHGSAEKCCHAACHDIVTRDIGHTPHTVTYRWETEGKRRRCSTSRRTHFLKNVTLSCRTCGMLPRSACHWLTHNFQNHSLPLIGWHSLLLILFSHQPRPAAAVHCTCSVATLFVGLSGTNLPSHFVQKFKSVFSLVDHGWSNLMLTVSWDSNPLSL